MTPAEKIARLEDLGVIVRGCAGCKVFYLAGDPSSVMAPRHEASSGCESGGHAHCTCDRCF